MIHFPGRGVSLQVSCASAFRTEKKVKSDDRTWLTVDEYDRLPPWLGLSADNHAPEVASGSGDPALYLARTTGCRVTGIDANEGGVTTDSQIAATSGEAQRVRFSVADANAHLPFDDGSFDALLRQEDVSDNAAMVADRWCRARRAHKDDLLRIEGEERFEDLQRFFEAVHSLTGQRRLSRITYVAEKRDQ